MSSSLEFKKIIGKNYGSYPSIELEFLPGKHCIIGRNNQSSSEKDNGAGKSTALELIYYTIYGDNPKGKDPSLYYKGNCSTEVILGSGEDEVSIRRYYKDSEFGNDLKLFINGEEVSERTKTGTQDQIQNIIGVPKELFSNFIGILQGTGANLCGMKPTLLKTTIEDLIGKSWDPFMKASKKSRERFTRDLVEPTTKINNIKSKINDLRIRIESENASTDKEKESILSQLKENKGKFSELSKKEVPFEEESYNKLKDKNRTIQASSIRLKQQIEVHKATVLKKNCPTCGQPTPQEVIEEAKKSLVECKKDLLKSEKQQDVISDSLKEAESLRDSYNRLKSDLSNVEFNIDNLKKRFKQLSEHAPKKDEYELELKSLSEEYEKLDQKVNSLEFSLKNYEYFIKILQPSSEFRTSVVHRYVDIINSEIHSLAESILDGATIQMEPTSDSKGITISISRGNITRSVSSFSGGEKSKINLIIMLALQRIHLSYFSHRSNVIFLDEFFDGIDSAGVANILESFDELYDSDVCCYVVSHNRDIKDNFFSYIDVVKDESGHSSIELENYRSQN